MDMVDGGTLGLWVLQTLDRRSCTQNELNERRPDLGGALTLFQVLCHLQRQGLISREADLPRYQALYHLTDAGRKRLHNLEEDHIAHHHALHLDRTYTDLFSLATRECSGMIIEAGAVLISSKRPDLLLTERACDLLATLVMDEKRQRYLITPATIPVPCSGTPLVSSLPGIALPSVSLDLVLIPIPKPAISTALVQEINRLLSIRGMLLIMLPFSCGAGTVFPTDDQIQEMDFEVPWFTLEEEMALIRTLDLYFDVYCLRHNRSALLICRRWGTGPDSNQKEDGESDGQVYPCRVVEVSD
jgi:DNA-binding PadR family transcriptional regulator